MHVGGQPSTLTIGVLISMKPAVFSVKSYLKKIEKTRKESGMGPFEKILILLLLLIFMLGGIISLLQMAKYPGHILVTAYITYRYGNIAPTTTNNQLICVVYTIIGLGLMMIFLANIGDLVSQYLATSLQCSPALYLII